MNKLTEHMKQVALDDLRLYFSIFIGAVNGIKAEVNRPRATRLSHVARDDVRLFFAPFTGAAAGVKQELQRREARKLGRMQKNP